MGMYSVITTVDNARMHSQKLLRKQSLKVIIRKKSHDFERWWMIIRLTMVITRQFTRQVVMLYLKLSLNVKDTSIRKKYLFY